MYSGVWKRNQGAKNKDNYGELAKLSLAAQREYENIVLHYNSEKDLIDLLEQNSNAATAEQETVCDGFDFNMDALKSLKDSIDTKKEEKKQSFKQIYLKLFWSI